MRALSLLLVLLTPVCTWATPSLDPIPTQKPEDKADVIETHPRRYGLMAGGLTLFAIGYVADAGVTYGVHHDPAGVSLIPLIGPLIQCGESFGYHGPMVATGNAQIDAQMNAQIHQASDLIAAVTYVGLAVDFAAQLAGLTMAIIGVSTRHTELRVSRTTRLAFNAHGVGLSF
jgi:hypothetical protein